MNNYSHFVHIIRRRAFGVSYLHFQTIAYMMNKRGHIVSNISRRYLKTRKYSVIGTENRFSLSSSTNWATEIRHTTCVSLTVWNSIHTHLPVANENHVYSSHTSFQQPKIVAIHQFLVNGCCVAHPPFLKIPSAILIIQSSSFSCRPAIDKTAASS